MSPMRGNNDERLDALLKAYRDACPDPEASPNFMPNLWQRIESRQTFAFSFRHMANAFVTVAVALCLALGVYTAMPHQPAPYPQSYLEALVAEANSQDTPDIVSPVRLDLPDAGR